MGNSSSTDEERMSEEYFLLDELVNHTVEEVAAHLMRLELNSEEKFSILSKKIHLRAIEDSNLCSKYVKLAKILSNVSCQQIETRREITFKDVFVNHSIQQFGSIRTSSESRFDLARFYGNLFVEGLVSSTLISYWINSLNNQKDLQDMMLDTIKAKVVFESRVYPEDQYIRALKTKLLERKIIQVGAQALGRAPCLEAKHGKPVLVNQNPQAAKSQLAEDFRFSLINIQQQPAPPIDLSRFRTSTDIDREQCAKIMLQRAMKTPANIEKYAEIARNIATAHSVASSKQKNFAGYLFEACMKDIESSLQQGNKNWHHIKTLGVFVSHLYIRSCTKVSLLNSWIGGVEGLISLEGEMAYPAYEMLVVIFEIVMPKMKTTSPLQHLKYIEKLKLWERALESKSTVASVSSAIPMPSNSGAIRKTSPPGNPAEVTATASDSNVFEQLHKICNKINIYNHEQILKEMLSLRIPENEKNWRKVANVLLQKGIFTAELRPTVCEILVNFPKQFDLQIKAQEFKEQVRLSLLSIITKIRTNTNCDQKWAISTINFIKVLHERSIIDGNVIIELVMDLTLCGSCAIPINFFMLVQTILVFKESTMDMLYHSSSNIELILREHLLDNLPENEQSDIRIALSIMQSSKARRERIATESLQNFPSRPAPSCLPSTSNVNLEITTNHPATAFPTDLRLHTVDQLNSFVASLNIGSSSAMKKLALEFFAATMKSVDFVAHAKLAQMIEKKFIDEKNPYDTLFKHSFIKKVQTSFNELFNLNTKQVGQVRHQARALVKFIGELYKIGWIGGEELYDMMKALVVHDDFMLESFRVLLQIVSILLVKNSEAEMCLQLLHSLNAMTSNENISQARNSFVTDDIKNRLEDVIELCNKSKTTAEDNERFLTIINMILDDMEIATVETTAKKIVALKIFEVDELEKFTDVLITKALSDSEDSIDSCSELISRVQGLSAKASDGSIVTFRQMITKKCHEMVVTNLTDQIDSELLQKALKALEFVSKLFSRDILKKDLINLCIEKLVEDQSDNSVDCLNFLLSTVDDKYDIERPRKLEICFLKFQNFAQSETESSCRSKMLKYLTDMRRNNWIPIDDEPTENNLHLNESSSSLLKVIFIHFIDENMPKAFMTSKHFVSQSVGNLKEFVGALWNCIILTPNRVKFLAELCEKLSVDQETLNYRSSFLEFLQIRVIVFTSRLERNDSELSLNRLGAVMMLIAELYVLDVVPLDKLEKLLKPAKLLPFDLVSKIISIIEPKISKCENIRLKALIINLDELSHEGSIKFLRDLKDDIADLITIKIQLIGTKM